MMGEDGLMRAKTIDEFLAVWLKKKLLDPVHQDVFDKYYWSYRRHFGARIRLAYSEQIQEAVRMIQMQPGLKVLEVGFGLGTESLWLAMMGANVTSIDILHQFVDTARRRKEIVDKQIGKPLNCEFRKSSVLDLESESNFDLIWMEQTFHHLEPRTAIVGKLVSLLKEGGHIIISEVNPLNPLMQLQLFIARGMNMYFTYTDEDGKEILVGRERIITAPKLRRMFTLHGVRCKGIRYFRIFPNHPFFKKFGLVERMLSRNWLIPIQTHFNYVGQKVF